MYKKLLNRTAMGLCLLVSVGCAVVPAVYAQGVDDAADFCRQLDEAGLLDEPGINITRGECVNFLTGPASEQANNAIAGLCGFDYVQALANTTNKGQCIQALTSEEPH